MADKTIGELKRATSLDDDSLMIAEQQGEAVSVTGGLFKSFAQESTKGFAESASADAATAVDAKNAAQSALKGVQDALNNLPSGGTLVINDLTTGGTTAALSAEMGKVLGQRPNPNLLHNWYFANPVNQRGKTEYTAAGYTIDRWKMIYWSATNPKVVVSSEGVTVSNENASGTPNTISFYQIVEHPERFAGQKATLSVLLGDVSINSIGVYLKIYINGSSFAGVRITNSNANGVVYKTATLPSEISSMSVYVQHDANNGGSGSVSLNLKAMKLELGDTQTLAHQEAGGNWVLNEIPNYGEELRKCQRYQLELQYTNYRASLFSADILEFAVPTPVTLRSLTPVPSCEIRKTDGTVETGFTFSAYMVNNGIKVVATKMGHGLTDGCLAFLGGAIFDANL